jgi:hypothetical protein
MSDPEGVEPQEKDSLELIFGLTLSGSGVFLSLIRGRRETLAHGY